MLKHAPGNIVKPLALVSASLLFATLNLAGCGSETPAGGGTGGRGTGGSSSGTGGTSTMGTGGTSTPGTGGAGTGGAGTGGSGTGGTGTMGTGGAGTGGASSVGTGGSGIGSGGNTSTGGAGVGTGGATATGGAGGGSASTGGAGGGAAGGAGGGSAAMATARIMPFGNGTITGTAVFATVADGVQVTITLQNCPAGVHGIHLHEGTSCQSMATQGMHWGGSGSAQNPSRGEGIGSGTGQITCNAQMMGGPLMYTRANQNANTRWTIGGPASSNVIGHPIVVHAAGGDAREGCGMIQAD